MLLPLFIFCFYMYKWEREDLVPIRCASQRCGTQSMEARLQDVELCAAGSICLGGGAQRTMRAICPYQSRPDRRLDSSFFFPARVLPTLTAALTASAASLGLQAYGGGGAADRHAGAAD